MQVMVFFSSCNSVKYHAELLNYIDIPVKDIHGKQKQQRRTTTFMDFCKVRCKGLLPYRPHAAASACVTIQDLMLQRLCAKVVSAHRRIGRKAFLRLS